MRVGAVLLMLMLAGCHGAQQVAVDAAFDVDEDGSGTSVKCLSSTGGNCQIDFRGALPKRVTLQPGEMKRYDNIGPGVPVCIEAEASAIAHCQPITLGAGYARIRKARSNRVG